MIKKKLIALIPARSGSERIKNKNIINFFGHPLIAYTIVAAIKSNLFDKIFVSTDSERYAKISQKYGADASFLRPKKISNSLSTDFEWIDYTLKKLEKNNLKFTHFFILRPTNPFRSYRTIKRAWKLYNDKNCESLRAIEPVKQHPGKMWTVRNGFLKSLYKGIINNQPYYNNQFKALPRVFIQNASLEITRTEILKKYKTISGKKIIPFYTKNFEGFDLNYPEDISYIKLNKKKIRIPKLS